MEILALTPEDALVWRLHRAAFERACADWPAASLIIGGNLERLGRQGRVAPTHLARCRELFATGPDAMRDAFLALTEEGRVLRSIHPLADVLSARERIAILRETGFAPWLFSPAAPKQK